jgi:hemerythrin-like domain-containing protein
MMDILTQLSSEHVDLRALLERIESAAEMGDATALKESLELGRAKLTIELDAHIAMEEDEAFGTIATALGEGLVAQFRADHIEIRTIRDEIYEYLWRGEPPYDASLRFCDLVLSHQQREDSMLFPSAREAASR